MITVQDCRQPYFPAVAKSNLNYLVVDGIILNGADTTIINLSRTQNLTDSNYVLIGETGAQVSLIGENAEIYSLTGLGNGKYIAPQLNLHYNETYQLKIITTNGEEYLSDSISVKQTPPIDSVSWKYDTSLIRFFVTTHDPSNNTRYYRWNYVESWQYQSTYFSKLIYQNGTLRERTPAENVYYCWSSANSTNILVGTSDGLSQDLIYEEPILDDSIYTFLYPTNHQLILPGLSQKFTIEYSILVNQYAITEAAYAFWQNLKLNTEGLGGLFSPEPSSQIPGNIHCITNPKEPVIGYVTASTLQQKRIFVNHYDLFFGTAPQPEIGCSEGLLQPDSIYYYLNYPTIYTPIDSAFNMAGIFIGIVAAPPYCADCEANGGINIKPAYWPN
ncbi:MAG TPA: DUF4249 domain-containing protein [Puia sp.]|nr:DUF4249 domain-containing protein [Puia sp.]